MFRHLLQPRASKGIASVLLPRITLQVPPFLVVPLRSITYRKERVQEGKGLRVEVRRLFKSVQQQQQHVKDIAYRVEQHELGEFTKALRREYIRKVFPDRNPLPFKFLSEIEECSKGTTDFKMTDAETLNWKKLKLELEKNGMTFEDVAELFDSMINLKFTKKKCPP